MAVIRFEKEYIKNKIKNVEQLHDLGVDAEENGDEWEFEITPDRPDLLSLKGVLRLLDVYKTKNPRTYKLKSKNPAGEIIVDKSVQDIRPFVTGAVVKNLNITEETLTDLMQLQEKIHATFGRKRAKIAVGIHNLAEVHFPVTYTTHKLNDIKFIPLDETKEMTATEIIENTEKGKAYAHLTKETKHGREGVFVEDDKGILSFPPIINADKTKLKPGKVDVFIDITGTHETAINKALNIIVTTLSEMGGDIYPIKIGNKIYPNLKYDEYPLPYETIEKFIGKKLSKQKIKELLNSMDWHVHGDKVKAQPYRTDIISKVDIAEDALIAYGISNIEPEFPNVHTIGKQVQEHVANEILTGLGFLEVKTWTLTNENKLKLCQANIKNVKLIKIINPLTEDFTVFRPLILPGLLEVLSESKKISMPHKIYEIGTVAPPERNVLALTICHPTATFAEIRSVVQTLIKETQKDGNEIKVIEYEDDRFIQGRCAALELHNSNPKNTKNNKPSKNKIIGMFGELHPEIITSFSIEQPVLYLETELF